MNCQDVNQNIIDYCDGLASPDLQSLIADHLDNCDYCRTNYQLTLLENQALRYGNDIPQLRDNFSALVINSIVSSNIADFDSHSSSQVISKNTSPRFKKSTLYKGLAMAAAVITLCFYIPNHMDINNINVSENFPQQQVGNNPSEIIMNDSIVPQLKTDGSITISQVNTPPKTGLGNQNKSSNTTIETGSNDQRIIFTDTVPAPTVVSAPTANIMAHSTETEKVSSTSVENNNPGIETQSYIPENVPTRFKLAKLDNTVENETVFNYVSADGKETFQLKISPVSPKMMAAKSIINSDSDASPLPLIKEVEVEGQSITLTITGNISNGELSNLINTIKIKKNTTQPLNSSPTN